MSDEAGRDRCTALWKTFSVKCATEEEEETESEEGCKRGSSGTIRQTRLGHVARVGVRGDTAAPLAKGFIYVLRPSILIKSVWFLHHHGCRRVESLLNLKK